MNIHVKMTRVFYSQLLEDLVRPHPFAFERIAFVSFKPTDLADGILLLASSLHSIRDDDYEPDDSVGAMLGPGAFRMALQHAYNHPVSMFHVHKHDHAGTPRDSPTDRKSSAQFVPDFWKVRPKFPHGTILLSNDSMSGTVWIPKTTLKVPVSKFTLVGTQITEVHHDQLSLQ